MVKLVIEDDEGKTTVVPLIRDEISVGRKEGNTIRLTERNVSRRHARLVKKNKTVYIEDLNSYNGIKINGNRITGRVAITEGDRIQIGDYTLALKFDKTPSVEVKTPPIEKVSSPVDQPAQSAEITEQAVTQQIVQPSPKEIGNLVCVSSNFAGLKFPLTKSSIMIGRSQSCDIVINHRSISAKHAQILVEENRYTVVDLKSRNGVRLNGDSCSKAELRKGDLIDLGHVRLRFIAPGEDFLFSRDATIVDLTKIETARRTWYALTAIVIIAVVGVILWRISTPTKIISPQPPKTLQAVSPTHQGQQLRALGKINQALEQKEWDAVLLLCKDQPFKAETEKQCALAKKEKAAQLLFEQGHAAETRNQHEQALKFYKQIPKESGYYNLLKESLDFQKAKTNYSAQMHARIDMLIKNGKCDYARTIRDELKTLLPKDTLGDNKILECKPSVIATTQPDEDKKPRPEEDTEHKTPQQITKKQKPVAAPTPEQIEKAKDLVKEARSAYVAGQHQRALLLAQESVSLVKDNPDAYGILGACHCYMKNATKARKVYTKLSVGAQRSMKLLCLRFGITLP